MCPEWIELPPGRDKARSKHTSPAGGRGREQAREPASHAAHAPLGAPSPPSVVRLSALCFGQGALQRMGRVPLLSLPCPSSTWRCLLHISHCHLNQPVPPQLHAHTHTRTHARTHEDTARPCPFGGGKGSDSVPVAIWACLRLVAGIFVPNSSGWFCIPPLWTRKTNSFFWLQNQQRQNQICRLSSESGAGVNGKQPTAAGAQCRLAAVGPAAGCHPRAASPRRITSLASEQPLQDQTGPGKGQT